MKCIELVGQDHISIRRGLDILDGMVKTMEDGYRIEIADVNAMLKFLRCFGDEYHQTMEETVLFPALLCGSPSECLLQNMLSDHAEERSLVEGIEGSLMAKRGMAFAGGSHRLSLLLREHLEKEDATFGNLAEETLSKEQDDAVVVQFLKSRTPPETYANFPRLERKYAPHGILARAHSGLARSSAAASYH